MSGAGWLWGSPERLAWRGLGGVAVSLAAEAGLVLLVARRVREGTGGDRWLAAEVGLGLLALVGLAVFARAVSLLRKGVREEVWTEEEMEAVRRRFEHRGWTFAMVALFLLYIAGNAFAPRHSLMRMLGFLAMLPALMIPSLLGSIRQPRVDAESRLTSEACQPIRSEHWGER